VPLAAKNNLDALYAQQRVLKAEAESLENERDSLEDTANAANRRYLLDVLIGALREEITRLNSSISDILERDLQR
jgi:prefoldin subunit 5